MIYTIWLAGYSILPTYIRFALIVIAPMLVLSLLISWLARRGLVYTGERVVEQEPVEFTEEELQRLAELRRRYVAQEVQP